MERVESFNRWPKHRDPVTVSFRTSHIYLALVCLSAFCLIVMLAVEAQISKRHMVRMDSLTESVAYHVTHRHDSHAAMDQEEIKVGDGPQQLPNVPRGGAAAKNTHNPKQKPKRGGKPSSTKSPAVPSTTPLSVKLPAKHNITNVAKVILSSASASASEAHTGPQGKQEEVAPKNQPRKKDIKWRKAPPVVNPPLAEKPDVMNSAGDQNAAPQEIPGDMTRNDSHQTSQVKDQRGKAGNVLPAQFQIAKGQPAKGRNARKKNAKQMAVVQKGTPNVIKGTSVDKRSSNLTEAVSDKGSESKLSSGKVPEEKTERDKDVQPQAHEGPDGARKPNGGPDTVDMSSISPGKRQVANKGAARHKASKDPQSGPGADKRADNRPKSDKDQGTKGSQANNKGANNEPQPDTGPDDGPQADTGLNNGPQADTGLNNEPQLNKGPSNGPQANKGAKWHKANKGPDNGPQANNWLGNDPVIKPPSNTKPDNIPLLDKGSNNEAKVDKGAANGAKTNKETGDTPPAVRPAGRKKGNKV